MNGMLLAFLITLIGAINLDFDLLRKGQFQAYIKGLLKNMKFGIIVAAVLAYFYMPPLIFPDILIPIGIMLVVNCASNLMGGINMNASVAQFKLRKVPIIILSVLLALYIVTPVYPLLFTEDLHELGGAEVSNAQLSQIDPEHIRQVPYQFAKWKSDKVIGDLGYKVHVGQLTIQLVDDSLYWVAPLEFGNVWKWFKYKTTPGYVMVDAENPDAKVVRVDNLEQKYMESSLLQSNVYRHAYQKYPNYRLREITYELDENRKPYWVISATRPTLWMEGEVVHGVIVIDPVTGDTQFYNEAPAWVDRVIPEELAEKYNYWYGAYVHGYWNTLFSQKDMHIPTTVGGRSDVFAVRTKEGMVWFTGHTSPSQRDQSLTGYATINTRSGEMTYYPDVSGYYNELAAIRAANAKVSNFEGYYGAQPIFYNLYGELSWVVPVLSSQSIMQKIAIVHAETGFTVITDNLATSLREYKIWINTELGKELDLQLGTDQTGVLETSGVVYRIKDDLIVLNNNKNHIFRVPTNFVELAITEKGDNVSVQYFESEETIVDVIDFDNKKFAFS